MHKTLIAALTFLAMSNQSDAQQSIRALTPTDDICGAYVTAILKSDQAKILGFGGWYLGFLSGVAQGTNIDFLRRQDAGALSGRLYNLCTKQADNAARQSR
jgi:hypothetical protein